MSGDGAVQQSTSLLTIPRVLATLAVNLLPLLFVLFFDWSAWHLLLLYCAEYFFSGFVLLMMINRASPYKMDVSADIRRLTGYILIAFGLFWHFLFFAMLFGIVLHVSPDLKAFESPPADYMTWGNILNTYIKEGLILPLAILIANQLYFYFRDFVRTEKYKRGHSGYYFSVIISRPFSLMLFIMIGTVLAMIINLVVGLQSLTLLMLSIMLLAKIILELLYIKWELKRL